MKVQRSQTLIKSNIKRHEPFINIEYGDLNNNNNDFKFRQRQLIVFYD